jgi:hypothetical protein
LKLLNRAINFSFAIQPVKFVLEYLKVWMSSAKLANFQLYQGENKIH